MIAYDVSTDNASGRRRLRRVARVCVNYGQRVQNSVFECVADAVTVEKIKHQLLGIIDLDCDSLRIYNLGNRYDGRIEQYGTKRSYVAEGFLVL